MRTILPFLLLFLCVFRGENSFYVRFLETDSGNLLKTRRETWGAFYRRRRSLTSREKAAGIRNPRKRPSARGPNRNNCRRFTRCSTALLPSYVRALRAFSRPHYCPHRGHEDRPQRPARQRTSCVPAPVVQIPRAGNFIFPPPPFAKKRECDRQRSH